MKVCVECNKKKPLSEFHTSGKGFRANCKACRANTDRRDKLKRHYGISPDFYDGLLFAQGGVCKICKEPESLLDTRTGAIMALAVDHDHSCCPGPKTCGKCIRGLLCARCNTSLGLLNDDVGLLITSILYLKGQL